MLKQRWSSTLITITWGITVIILTAQRSLAQRAFEIRNITNQKITHIYGTPSNAETWGLDYLGQENSLNQGESIRVSLGQECLYDFKIQLANGQEIEELQINTCSNRFLAVALGENSISNTPENSGQISGFFCDLSTGIPETKYQHLNGNIETWIRWNSDFFNNSGYDPITRCELVSERLENYRNRQELNYIGIGKMNGQNVICSAIESGICHGLIYTLKPQQDPLKTLQQFMEHRMGIGGVSPLYESEDDNFTPFFDIRPYLDPLPSISEEKEPDQPEINPELRPL